MSLLAAKSSSKTDPKSTSRLTARRPQLAARSWREKWMASLFMLRPSPGTWYRELSLNPQLMFTLCLASHTARRLNSAGYRRPGPRFPARRTASRIAVASRAKSIVPSCSKGATLADAIEHDMTGRGEELRAESIDHVHSATICAYVRANSLRLIGSMPAAREAHHPSSPASCSEHTCQRRQERAVASAGSK